MSLSHLGAKLCQSFGIRQEYKYGQWDYIACKSWTLQPLKSNYFVMKKFSMLNLVIVFHDKQIHFSLWFSPARGVSIMIVKIRDSTHELLTDGQLKLTKIHLLILGMLIKYTIIKFVHTHTCMKIHIWRFFLFLAFSISHERTKSTIHLKLCKNKD